MPDPELTDRPWKELERLVGESDAADLSAYLDALPAAESVRAVSRLSDADQNRLLTTIGPEAAAGLIEQMPGEHAAELIGRLAPGAAAAIVDQLPSDQQADLIADLHRDDAAAILAAMDPAEAHDAINLSRYHDEVAGGLMVTEYVAYPEDRTVEDVVHDLREQSEKYRDYELQYAYVTAAGGELVGVLRLRDLLLAPRTAPIHDLMRREIVAIRDTDPLEDLRELFNRHGFLGAPVVGADGKLLGVVTRAAVDEAGALRADSDYRKAQGIVGGEELRTMPLVRRASRRLGWLSVNIVLNMIAASVIAVYQSTLEAAIALAVFLPIISDMSGCAGNQAVAVSVRELTLGLVRPTELLRVWLKEISVGVINGIVLGVLIALAAVIWKGNPWLGLVVGTAMAANTLVAVTIGGLIPLLLRRFRMDPALASGPILTTITDMCGFFFVLSLASVVLERLG